MCQIRDKSGLFIRGAKNRVEFSGGKIKWELTGGEDILSVNVTKIVNDKQKSPLTGDYCNTKDKFSRKILNIYHTKVKASSTVTMKFICNPAEKCDESTFLTKRVYSRSQVTINCAQLQNYLSDAFIDIGISNRCKKRIFCYTNFSTLIFYTNKN